MARARIVIPTNFRGRNGSSDAQAYLNDAYVRAVWAAGGLPVLAPPPEVFDEELADAYAAQGLLLTGGADIAPALYGQAPHPRITPLDPRRQAAELGWFAWADRRGVPVLGICLGCQLINVGRGGSLIQYLPERAGGLDHGQGGRDAWHDVAVTGDRLGALVGPIARQVNSRHRQAVDRLGTGLRPAGQAADGVVEAIEGANEHFLLGVQWHPEDLPDHPAAGAIFRAFMQAAGAR